MPTDPHDEHIAAAKSAGLRYVTDAQPGITRKRAGSGWTFVSPKGKRVTDATERQRLLSLAIPPAWTDVWICADPRGHLQVTARDVKGRKQYRYHPKFRAERDESKFDRMLAFSAGLPRLRERIERDLALPGLPRRKLLATMVRLLDKTLIRIGNEEYLKANKSVGLTTMRRRHVAVDGHTLTFSFRGKSGVQHEIAVTDRRLARIVKQLQELPGQELFHYVNDDGERVSVDSGDVNEYLQELCEEDVTAKDFRTWSGTMLAARALRDAGQAATETEARRNVNAALDSVAKRLGNTRAVARKYYVHPAVIAAYHRGVAAPEPRRAKRGARPSAALRRDEVLVLQFLHDQLEAHT
ncbi:MAG: DNA topoisomerase IB [Gemmatimonadaceae bacterium]|nr:DNA topoisomerase IB [Gemmatimonadaceae bacterium]